MILRAIGAYNAQVQCKGDLSKFCRENFLRAKSMEEITKLYRQLCHIMENQMNIKVGPLLPPNLKQESLLRQIFLSGHPDCVAKLNENHPLSQGSKAVPVYETSWSNETEYFVIHPSSCLSRSRPAPKYVIYDHIQARQDILATDNTIIENQDRMGPQRKFLKVVSAVDVTWLADQESFVNQGKLLDLPQPCYERKEDNVVGFISPTYGSKLWPLPVTKKNLDNQAGLPYFAQALLEGKIDIGGNFNVFSILLVSIL